MMHHSRGFAFAWCIRAKSRRGEGPRRFRHTVARMYSYFRKPRNQSNSQSIKNLTLVIWYLDSWTSLYTPRLYNAKTSLRENASGKPRISIQLSNLCSYGSAAPAQYNKRYVLSLLVHRICVRLLRIVSLLLMLNPRSSTSKCWLAFCIAP